MKPFRLEQIRKEQWILLLLVGILIMTAVFPSGKERESMAGSTTESESQSSPQEEADLEERHGMKKDWKRSWHKWTEPEKCR